MRNQTFLRVGKYFRRVVYELNNSKKNDIDF